MGKRSGLGIETTRVRVPRTTLLCKLTYILRVRSTGFLESAIQISVPGCRGVRITGERTKYPHQVVSAAVQCPAQTRVMQTYCPRVRYGYSQRTRYGYPPREVLLSVPEVRITGVLGTGILCSGVLGTGLRIHVRYGLLHCGGQGSRAANIRTWGYGYPENYQDIRTLDSGIRTFSVLLSVPRAPLSARK